MKNLIQILTIIFSGAVFASVHAPDSNRPLSAIESNYWNCDYASTHGILDQNDSVMCSLVFEELKKIKFNGNFREFMKWWNDNKTAEHNKRRGYK